MIRIGTAFFLLAALACSGKQTQNDVEQSDGGMNQTRSGLASSVQVEVTPETVRLVLHVTNPTNQPVTLEFTSGQRYDFAIRSASGQDLWRWSADKSFIQALGSQTLAPGATLQFSESWNPGGRKGSFVATAELTASNHRIQESAQFEIR